MPDFSDVRQMCRTRIQLTKAMDPSAPRETKIDALHRARQHNLDVAVIAKETVRMILEVAFAVSSVGGAATAGLT